MSWQTLSYRNHLCRKNRQNGQTNKVVRNSSLRQPLHNDLPLKVVHRKAILIHFNPHVIRYTPLHLVGISKLGLTRMGILKRSFFCLLKNHNRVEMRMISRNITYYAVSAWFFLGTANLPRNSLRYFGTRICGGSCLFLIRKFPGMHHGRRN